MNAAEAMTRLIKEADSQLSLNVTRGTDAPEQSEHEKELETATAICQAMLNMMLPVAKYRAHVEVDEVQEKRGPGKAKLAAYAEFTACSAKMDGIKSSMIALSTVDTNVRVTIFEQRANGADMLVAYQGRTKTQNFRIFLDQLSGLEAAPVLN